MLIQTIDRLLDEEEEERLIDCLMKQKKERKSSLTPRHASVARLQLYAQALGPTPA